MTRGSSGKWQGGDHISATNSNLKAWGGGGLNGGKGELLIVENKNETNILE